MKRLALIVALVAGSAHGTTETATTTTEGEFAVIGFGNAPCHKYLKAAHQARFENDLTNLQRYMGYIAGYLTRVNYHTYRAEKENNPTQRVNIIQNMGFGDVGLYLHNYCQRQPNVVFHDALINFIIELNMAEADLDMIESVENLTPPVKRTIDPPFNNNNIIINRDVPAE